jgi:adenosylcobinamide-GDP ribazoletransferase
MGAAWAFPVVGAGVGAVAAIAFGLAVGLSLPPLAVALLAVTAGTLVTGALHEDGFADVADGFGGGRDAEAKRRIMRDSRIGSYGVMGLILVVGLKVAALAAIPNGADAAAALVASHALGRAVIPALSHFLPFAAPDGLARLAGTAERWGMLWAAGLGLGLAVIVVPAGIGIHAAIAAVGAAAVIGWLAHRQIGGATGDVFGAGALLAETAALLAITASLGA